MVTTPLKHKTRRHFFAKLLSTLAICVPLTLSSTFVQAAQEDGDAPLKTDSILVLGDSLSSGYGLEPKTGWVSLMEERFETLGREDINIINASLSGDTTAGGRTRIRVSLKQHHPTIVIIALGANDALRGLSIAESKANFEKMIELCKDENARIILLGVQVPPNYGKEYTTQFTQMYEQLVQEHQLAYVPFFLKGIADVADTDKFFQRDRIHPNESAQSIILRNVWPTVLKVLVE